MNFFFDIGANQGQAFDWHLCKTPVYDGWEVYLFEPSPRSLAKLLEKAEEMAHRYQVTVLPFAIDGSIGTALFNESADSLCDTLQHGSLHNELWNYPSESGYRVMVAKVKLSDFILQHTHPGDRIVIKLDAEGSEYGIVQDLLNHPEAMSRVKEMLIEWHYVAQECHQERLLEESLMAQLKAAGCDAKIWPY